MEGRVDEGVIEGVDVAGIGVAYRGKAKRRGRRIMILEAEKCMPGDDVGCMVRGL